MSRQEEDEGEDNRQTASKEQAQAPATDGSKAAYAQIGDRLRRTFDEVVEEPIPEKFKALLESLKK